MANQIQVSKVEEMRLKIRTSLSENEVMLLSDIRRSD